MNLGIKWCEKLSEKTNWVNQSQLQWCPKVGAKQSEWARGSKPKPQLTYLHCPSELKITHLEWQIGETGKIPAARAHVIVLRLKRKTDWSQAATVVSEWMNSIKMKSEKLTEKMCQPELVRSDTEWKQNKQKKRVVLCGVLCILIALLKKVEVWEGGR